ncbi:hypothetical protein [Lactococcus lactis]|uniref:Uncharacterized protein n=1 Tax=Lactococcus lactis TaxID=1358 RepID=A0AAP3Z273_9LACT|nr:hypothetical protein [Lactococcus lactis]MDG4977023.1 hypothetical protein [Lactococcus lactis]
MNSKFDKLLGAGGQDFYFFVSQDFKEKVRRALDLPEIKFSYDIEGTKIIYGENN